ARQDHTGVEDLVGDAADAGQEQQEEQVGVDQDVEQLERPRHVDRPDLGGRGVQRELLVGRGHPVDAVEQGGQAGLDVVDQVLVQRLACLVVGRLGDREDGRVAVTPM